MVKSFLRHFRAIIEYNMKYFSNPAEYSKLRLKMLEQKSFAQHLSTLFKTINVQCVLDVGGNIGGYRNFLRDRVGYKGLIITFEPVKKNVEKLNAKSQGDSNWFIYDFALGSENTQKEINVMSMDVFSSFLQPDHEVVDRFMDWNVVDYKETVEVKTLDSVMGALKDRHVLNNIFLKMDTQGYDLEVVTGAQQTLDQVLALQTEVSIRRIYQGMPNFIESYQALTKKGFDITGMYPVTRDSLQRVIEFDCVMVNKALGS